MAVITISRQFGAGGKTFGYHLSKRLGYAFADEEIIQLIASKAKVSSDWVKAVEKEAGGNLLKYISGMHTFRKSFLARALESGRGYLDEEIYVDLLHEVIREFAEKDNIVIIGRAGQYILKDYPNSFHIFLYADIDYRVGFMEKKYNLTHEQAVHVVGRMTVRRENLYRKFGKTDYDHPNLYHLGLDMRKLPMETVIDLVCELVR